MVQEMVQENGLEFATLLDRVLSGFSLILYGEAEQTSEVERDDWCIVGNPIFFANMRAIKNKNGKSVYEAIKQILPYMDFQEGCCDIPDGEFAIGLLRHRRESENGILSERTRII